MSPHFHDVHFHDVNSGSPQSTTAQRGHFVGYKERPRDRRAAAEERRTATNTRGSRRGYRAAKAAHSAFLSGIRGIIALVMEDIVDNIFVQMV